MAETLELPDDSEMCPPGFHVVQGFSRVCHSGVNTWVDAHIRRNRMILAGFPNKKGWIEIKRNLIFVDKKDRFDPVVNIALGIRLLGYKFAQLKSPEEKTMGNMIARYDSRGPDGLIYLKKIIELYEKSRKLR